MFNILKISADFYVQIFLLIITSYCLHRLLSNKYRKKLPPGPIGLPFLGYLPFLGDKPHETIAKLSKKYGSIIGIKIGSQYNVVFNEYNVMKEVFCHPATMDRDIETFHGFPMGFGASGGTEWQEQRKFCLRTMKNLGLGKGPWEKLTRESMTGFTEELRSFKGQPADITELTLSTLGINILSLLVGRKVNPITEKEIVNAATSFPSSLSHFGANVAGSIIPGFRKFCVFFRLLGYNEAEEKITTFFNECKKEVKAHQSQSHSADEDFIQIYQEKMKQMETENVPHYFSEENLLGNIAVLYVGGSDTLASSMEWLIRLMAKYPKVQEKVQKELDEVIGRDGVITYEERNKVPYTFAVMQEAQRYASIFPLAGFRSVIYDFEIGGYTIPKGSVVVANRWAINNDPNCYKNPEIFLPERFLDKDTPKLTTFSFGKRNCPGELIAWMVILIFFSNLMQKFTISIPPGVELNFGGNVGFSSRMNTLLLCFKERK